MRLKKGFELRTICGEHVISATGIENINFDKIISLNETAAFIWQTAAELGVFTTPQLLDALCKEYDVDRQQAQSDIEALLVEWMKEGLLEEA